MKKKDDLNKIIKSLRSKINKKPSLNQNIRWRNESCEILDCVLSLMRQYDKFVVPRVQLYKNSIGKKIKTIEQLIEYCSKNGGFHIMFKEILGYDHCERARIMSKVCAKCVILKAEHKSMAAWANIAKVEEFKLFGVKGFGISGYQYLRMRFGAQTTKPDTHINRFVRESLGRTVNGIYAVQLIEDAAKQLGWPARGIDGELWALAARD